MHKYPTNNTNMIISNLHEYNTNITNVGKVLYPELSYRIMGILFEIHNKLGTKYKEVHYGNVFEIKLKHLGISYEREKPVKTMFENEKFGDFYLDFVINNQIIIEFKKVWSISFDDIKQVLRYLEATNLKLAIIANFKHKRLQYRRVLR